MSYLTVSKLSLLPLEGLKLEIYLVLKNLCRRSCPEMFYKIGVLKNFSKFTEKQLRLSLFFIKRSVILLKKRLQHRCFPVNIAKFLRTLYLEDTSGRHVFVEHSQQQQKQVLSDSNIPGLFPTVEIYGNSRKNKHSGKFLEVVTLNC